MKTVCIAASLAIFSLSGCSTPGTDYAKAHPELSAAHRQILIDGAVPGGLAVEGMTKEQVRVAMGEPTTIEKLGGGDAWVYVRESWVDSKADAQDEKRDSGAWGAKKSADRGGRQTLVKKTTIFFQGDRATEAQLSEERH